MGFNNTISQQLTNDILFADEKLILYVDALFGIDD